MNNREQEPEELIGAVSHDLRNPLAVARGHLELARKECDSEHLSRIGQAHERMGALIDELVTLAHEKGTGVTVDSISLPVLVEECWQNVATAKATLSVDTDVHIIGDQTRLKQVFENLFRNAIDHAEEDVEVTVGPLSDGFYVADNGPGIPTEKHEKVLELGYTTTEGGTGFGLSIVAEIVDAHGWTMRITESPSGGAQFEITGIITER